LCHKKQKNPAWQTMSVGGPIVIELAVPANLSGV